MLGKKPAYFAFAEDRDKTEELLTRTSGGIERFKLRFRKKDDSELWAAVTTNSLCDSSNRPCGPLILLTDITESRIPLSDFADFARVFFARNRPLISVYWYAILNSYTTTTGEMR